MKFFEVIYLSAMFYRTTFNSDISNWDVTDMSYMFHCSNFKGDISRLKTSKVVNFKGDIKKILGL